MNKHFINSYYFSFEGETEKWYLEWLNREINKSDKVKGNVLFKLIGKKPIKSVKILSVLYNFDIYHFCDYEDRHDDKTLKKAIDFIRAAERLKNIKYHLSYSNLTFELWMILHKQNCNAHFLNNSSYLQFINSCYNEKFQSLAKYKEEKNFKRILSKITLEDVKNAIQRANKIMKNNKNSGFQLHEYRKEQYYKENPSLSVHEIIEKILRECGII